MSESKQSPTAASAALGMGDTPRPVPPAFTLTLTEGQAHVLRDACDCLSRMSCGQFRIAWDLSIEHNPALYTRQADGTVASAPDWEEYLRLRDALDAVGRETAARLAGFDATRGAEPGFGNPRVSDRVRVAYDIHQVLRKALNDTQPNPDGTWSVNAYDARRTSTEEPLPTIERVGVERKEKP